LIRKINMKKWIEANEALALLRVKPQTLYAYVSRGRIAVAPDPADPRRSLYDADDVAQIIARRARGRAPKRIAASALDWGEPSVPTRVSTVRRGALIYRGKNAMDFARAATLEEAAQLLWESKSAVAFRADARPKGNAFETLAARIAAAKPMPLCAPDDVRKEAAQIVDLIAQACGAEPGEAPLHQRIARGWGRAAAAEPLRQALVAMADHDINASTFAARVAASTGAALAACVLAGLCALSGPRHGGAFALLRRALDCAREKGCAVAVEKALAHGGPAPGFGHPLYPHGDPRAALMLEALTLDPLLAEFCALMTTRAQALPNCDFGLVSMALMLDLPADAPFKLFLIGRSVGWCAHAMEQNASGELIRPRGRYIDEA
jgi:citrate synthase